MYYLVPSDYTLKLYEHIKAHVKDIMWVDPMKKMIFQVEDTLLLDDSSSDFIFKVLEEGFAGEIIVFSSLNSKKNGCHYIDKFRSIDCVIRDLLGDTKKWFVMTGTYSGDAHLLLPSSLNSRAIYIDTSFTPDSQFNLFRDAQKDLKKYCVDGIVTVINSVLDLVHPPVEVLEENFRNLNHYHHLLFSCFPIKGPLDGLILSSATHILSVHSEQTPKTDLFDKQINTAYKDAHHQSFHLSRENLNTYWEQILPMETHCAN